MKKYPIANRVLESYIYETLVILSSNSRSHKRKSLKEKWSIIDDYFQRRHVLSESKVLLAESKLMQAWQGLKNIATLAGKKIIDSGAWVKSKAKNMSKKAQQVMTKIAKNLQEIVVYCIKQLPGGEVVLEFLTEIAVNLKERISEMREAIGKKVEEFVKTAKKKIIDFFFEYVLKDDEMKQDFYAAMGLSEADLAALQNESKNLGIRTISELNLHLNANKKVRKILNEEDGEDESSIVKKIKEKTGIKDAEDTAKVLGFIENKNKKGDQDVNPETFLRGKAAKVMEDIIKFWLKLVKKNPRKYHKPFYESGFFSVFGKTGFGLASAAILGILGSTKLEWNNLVNYVKFMVRGFVSSTSAPVGSTTDRAGAFLFLGNQGNNYDASLFTGFITGIIEGSNIEYIIRALAGDPTKVPELCKRLVGAIISAVKTKINEAVPEAVQQAAGEPIDDDVEEEVTQSVESYIDDVYSV